MEQLSERIRELIEAQGWNRDTQLRLLCDFIEERHQVVDLYAYLAWVASGEPYPANPAWIPQIG